MNEKKIKLFLQYVTIVTDFFVQKQYDVVTVNKLPLFIK